MNKVENLTRYVESGIADNKMLKKASTIELKESISNCTTKLRESINSEESEGWWVPISFYNRLNGNNRNYNRELWENVLNNQKDIYIGSPMLTDHPEGDSDGNPKDICGVWLDAKMDEPGRDGSGLVWGLLIPSGRLGEDLKDHIKHGLKVGTSSSGFGKLLSDGVTVDPETYQIERLADFVLNPSQGTFFSYDESFGEVEDRSIRESLNTHNNVKSKENSVKDSRIAKLEEKKFRKDMESFLEDANNIKDPQEKLEEFREIRSYLEDGACPDLREKIESKIEEQETLIKDMLNESITLKEQFGIESAKDLEEKLTLLTEDARIIENESKDWKAIAEKLQEKYDSTKKSLDERPTTQYTQYLESKNKKLLEQSISQNKKAAEMVGKMIESYEKLKKDFKDCKSENECLKKDLENKDEFEEKAIEADANNSQLYKDLETAYDDLKERFSNLLRRYKVRERKLEYTSRKLEEASESLRRMKALKEHNENMVHSLKRDVSDLSDDVKALRHREFRAKKQKEAESQEASLTDVERYYEDLYDIYGDQVAPFKEDIISSENITEAKKVFYTDVIQHMEESENIENTRIPKTSYISAEDREKAMGLEFKKSSIVDRKPKGWK